MAVLPHVAHVVERHFGIAASVVPPFVADYFFDAASATRQQRILFVWKDAYRAIGVPDQDIARALLSREIAKRPAWEFVSLEGFTHREVAQLMGTSMFLVNVNSHEAFNTTVPEAMAAGCIPVCYEATGGRDFLKDGSNAIVFSNQQVFALVERVCELVDHFDENTEMFSTLRAGGRETALSFSPENTARALKQFFGSRLAR
jgi:glycosyltransferase involved in cell wall biosynthesis